MIVMMEWVESEKEEKKKENDPITLKSYNPKLKPSRVEFTRECYDILVCLFEPFSSVFCSMQFDTILRFGPGLFYHKRILAQLLYQVLNVVKEKNNQIIRI